MRVRALLAVVVMLMCASCGNTPTAPSATATAPGTVGFAATPSPTFPPITPVPGNYSIYIDPTWGYRFQYPATWTVYPQIGNSESNVIIAAPYNPSPDQAMLRLEIRVTNDDQHDFVTQYLCHAKPTTSVNGIPAVDLSSPGGDVTNGLTALVLARGFFTHNLAFLIWLQSSGKSYATFVSDFQPMFMEILASFSPGAGAKTSIPCP